MFAWVVKITFPSELHMPGNHLTLNFITYKEYKQVVSVFAEANQKLMFADSKLSKTGDHGLRANQLSISTLSIKNTSS